MSSDYFDCVKFIETKNGKTFARQLGSAKRRDDGGFAVYLDAIPPDGKFSIVPQRDRSSGTRAQSPKPAAARACAAMGFETIQTYILEEEPGTSLKASGWYFDQMTSGGDWNHSVKNAGTRRTDQPMGKKQRWRKKLNG